MHLLIIIIQIYFVNSNNGIKQLNNKYRINSNREGRCIPNSNVAESLALSLKESLGVSEKESFSEINSCHKNDCEPSASAYQKQNILDGLLIHEDIPDSHWSDYKSVYKKQYKSPVHEKSALAVWTDNFKRVAEHNRLFLEGKRSYTLHLNHFGDWPIFAYIKQLLKLIWTVPLFDPARDPHRTTYRKHQNEDVPTQVDWRAMGYKPRREEQWHCGACYAFAITHALQAQLYKIHGDWHELSPQQIVDCSYSDGNLGCNGGSLQAALRYAARAGLIKETYYPYYGKKGHCQYNSRVATARPRRWATLPSGDEAAMEKALATIGPLAVAVNAEPFTFQLYRSGIYDDPFCVPWKLNHAMLLVGYTPEYWILLNWWGKKWGEDGYMRIRRGYNVCGVANMATYVEL